jgi:hypothetical protein
MIRIQSGGPAEARQLVGSQIVTRSPTGQVVDVYYVRFKAKHPNGQVFEDVYLEKEAGIWKVAGFWLSQVPPG